MSNTKNRKKLLWGMRMMMRDIKLSHGWHEPYRSYMRVYRKDHGDPVIRIAIRRLPKQEVEA